MICSGDIHFGWLYQMNSVDVYGYQFIKSSNILKYVINCVGFDPPEHELTCVSVCVNRDGSYFPRAVMSSQDSLQKSEQNLDNTSVTLFEGRVSNSYPGCIWFILG